VELHGVDLPDLGTRVEELCLGFPVAVLFNGQPLKRRLAEGHLATQASPIGAVHLAGTLDGKYSHETMVFLQGFCVLKPTYCLRDELNVVHLDSRQFMARLPDRDKLIDEDVQRKRIDAELKACWRNTLEIAKDPTVARALRRDLLRGDARLGASGPAERPGRVAGRAVRRNRRLSDPGRPRFTRFVQQVAAARRAAISRAAPCGWSPSTALGTTTAHAGCWPAARAIWCSTGSACITSTGRMRHVRFLEEERVHVEAVKNRCAPRWKGRWVWPDVILCESRTDPRRQGRGRDHRRGGVPRRHPVHPCR
jgi:hypothetical protein